MIWEEEQGGENIRFHLNCRYIEGEYLPKSTEDESNEIENDMVGTERR